MSKLGDAIRRSQRVESAPMGFAAARPAPKATMLVGLINGQESELSQAKEAGADVIIVDRHGHDVQLSDIEKLEATDLPVGIAGRILTVSMEDLHKGGLDFLAFEPDHTPATALLAEDLGFVIRLPEGADESYLRSLESISLEAMLIAQPKLPLSAANQIELGRLAMLTHKPLICSVDPTVSKEDLQCLRAAGVAVVLSQSIDGVKALKATVAALPPRKVHKEEQRTIVSLPRGAAPSDHEDDDDDE